MVHQVWVEPVLICADHLQEVKAPKSVGLVAKEGLNIHERPKNTACREAETFDASSD